MGRTILPYSQQLELTKNRFQDFRRALRKEDQHRFDKIMRMGLLQQQAGVMASHPDPFDSLAMSVFIDLLRQLEQCQQQLERLSQKLRHDKPTDG